MYTDARITRIFAGTSEVMELIVGCDVFSDRFVPYIDRQEIDVKTIRDSCQICESQGAPYQT